MVEQETTAAAEPSANSAGSTSTNTSKRPSFAAANPLLRVAVGTLVPLFLLQYFEVPLPMLVSVFTVVMLTLMPGKPSVSVLLQLTAVVVVAALVQSAAGNLLGGTGTGTWLFLFAVLFYSLSRIHLNPKDVVGLMMMILGIVVTVLHFQYAMTLANLPWLLALAFISAIGVIYLMFWLFPGGELEVSADISWEVTPSHWLKVLAKALFIMLIIFLLMDADSSQALLIVITLTSLIKDPNPLAGSHNARQRLWTTWLAVVYSLPLLIVFWLDMAWWLQMLLAVALALWLGAAATARKVSMAEYQLLMSGFVMLVYQVISHQGAASLTSSLMRLGSVIVAVLLGMLLLSLLSELGSQKPDRAKAASD